MNHTYARVLADSKHPISGDRLTTLVVNFPRAILPQVLTHRVFSRNTASQRAIPLRKQIRAVLAEPFVPERFASEKAGMAAGVALTPFRQALATGTWYAALVVACVAAYALGKLGVHKQWSARLLFPFQYCRMIITSSGPGIANFLKLRDADDAQPEITDLARAMAAALAESTPRELALGQAHLPFPSPGTLDLETELVVNTARAARISYDKVSGEGPASVEDDRRLYLKLLGTNGKIHGSAFEHCAIAVPPAYSTQHRNLSPGWRQYRAMVEDSLEPRLRSSPNPSTLAGL